jgi:RimJ/RimL family protein N-acetyltransferase
MPVTIDTGRFHLRELREDDATERYLGWLGDAAAMKYITAAAVTKELSDLRLYIRARIGRDDVLFLGIFEKSSGAHIGNIKYEPVDSAKGFAIMGILIGDPQYRGKGVAPEVLKASARWLRAERAITQIVLGVSHDNAAAIRAYQQAGFVIEGSPFIPGPRSGYATMVQTANLTAEPGHDRLGAGAGAGAGADADADAEPIPELEFDQTVGW